MKTFEQFYDLDDNTLNAVDFVNSKLPVRIADMVNEVLVVLQNFYNTHKNDSINEWLKMKTKSLKKDLVDVIDEVLSGYFDELVEEQNNLYFLPVDFELLEEWSWLPVVKSRVDAVVNRLAEDIQAKAMYFKYFPSVDVESFSVSGNFRQAIRDVTNLVDFNSQSTLKWVEREYVGFVYGKDNLYDWVCSGVNTCEWCYSVEAGNPYFWDELPLDHINGHCRIKPVNTDKFSEEYLEYRL